MGPTFRLNGTRHGQRTTNRQRLNIFGIIHASGNLLNLFERWECSSVDSGVQAFATDRCIFCRTTSVWRRIKHYPAAPAAIRPIRGSIDARPPAERRFAAIDRTPWAGTRPIAISRRFNVRQRSPASFAARSRFPTPGRRQLDAVRRDRCECFEALNAAGVICQSPGGRSRRFCDGLRPTATARLQRRLDRLGDNRRSPLAPPISSAADCVVGFGGCSDTLRGYCFTE